jgi:hypothetical protein
LKAARLDQRVWLALASVTLLAGALAAGLDILPIPGRVRPTAVYAIHGSTGIPVGYGPVFLLGGDLFPHQCGTGHLGRNGVLTLIAYREPRCRLGIARLHPHLLPIDLRVPWALVPADKRQDLRRLATAAGAHFYLLGQRLIHAPFFVEDYAPVIDEVVRSALRQAWSAPTTRQALTQALDTLDRDQVSAVVDGLLPVLAEHIRQNLWRTLRTAASALFGSEDRRQREALGQLLGEVLADPRVALHLERTVPPLLSSREALAVGTVLADQVGKALVSDPRLQDLMARLVTDRRFLGLRPIGPEAEHLFAALPGGLLRMRFRHDHNPLATYVLRALVRGRSGFLVLMLSEHQEGQLLGSDLPPEPVLGGITQ